MFHGNAGVASCHPNPQKSFCSMSPCGLECTKAPQAMSFLCCRGCGSTSKSLAGDRDLPELLSFEALMEVQHTLDRFVLAFFSLYKSTAVVRVDLLFHY